MNSNVYHFQIVSNPILIFADVSSFYEIIPVVHIYIYKDRTV